MSISVNEFWICDELILGYSVTVEYGNSALGQIWGLCEALSCRGKFPNIDVAGVQWVDGKRNPLRRSSIVDEMCSILREKNHLFHTPIAVVGVELMAVVGVDDDV
ncbi:hypothetical protein L195_g034547 [Trifolium pratense]|uniref:Uncharacterized protein n=1 Tax=Trifolium pratense TaxID=57577 RepID=A0A2K3LJ98_TRIPR|nr:hypothetical protein L195_g034547 [Trifolium pratense]